MLPGDSLLVLTLLLISRELDSTRLSTLDIHYNVYTICLDVTLCF